MKDKTKVVSAVVFLLAFLICVSCQKQGAEWKGTIEEVNGIKVVHNFEPDPDESFKPIEFIVDLSIGEEGDDVNYMFSAPRHIDADSQGNIYVLDSREFTVKKYDSQGKPVKNIGRFGQGPGELDLNPFNSTERKIHIKNFSFCSFHEQLLNNLLSIY